MEASVDDRAASARRPSRRAVMRAFTVVVVVGIAFLAVGNAAILGATWWARAHGAGAALPKAEGVRNLRAVDADLWRGAAPSGAGLADLARQGVTTVVDLRAEDDLVVDAALYGRLGLRRVHLPVRDGQVPTEGEVRGFLAVVDASDGRVFLHCGAGVGRTGTMAAAYLVSRGQATSEEALRRNLAVGPPSLEQIAYVARLGAVDGDRPGSLLVATSRVLDAPRRLWSRARA